MGEKVYDVAIIGGGVSGCAIARELSRYKLRITLLERAAEVGFGTTKTNSGIIHPGHHSPANTVKGKLAVRGNALFDALHQELNFGFKRIGELVVAREEGDLVVLQQLLEQGQQKGVPGLEIWQQKKLRREEPNLSHGLLGALYAPTAGVINPYEFAFSLIKNAVDNGVDLRVSSPVTKIDVEPEGFRLHTPRNPVEARLVINCAGVFADKVAEMAGAADFSIHPRKGEEYMLDKRLRGLVRRLIFPVPSQKSKGVLIIPTFDGTLMVGPTAQDTDDRYDLSTSVQGAKQVFSSIKTFCPAISERDTITEFAGLRAVSNSNDFVIGPSSVPGFVHVAGIQSPGLTASPAIAEMVRDIVRDISEQRGASLEPKTDFETHVVGPPRFAQASAEQRLEMIEGDKLFARVVCRCELVTEAEIHHAIDQGAHTLDGIKFRSRAGMGRCQGGFCTSRAMEILAQRTGRSFSEITKRGGDSWLVTPMVNEQHPQTEEVED